MTDFDNFFDVHETTGGDYAYNLNETLYLNAGRNGGGLPVYIAKHEMQWTLASYLIYDTTRLAWLLMKLNGVDALHMFDNIKVGQPILYLKQETVRGILDGIREG